MDLSIQPRPTVQHPRWETRSVDLPLSGDDAELTADHRVNGRSIVPAAVLLLHVARQCKQTRAGRTVLKNVQFHRPIHGAEMSALELCLHFAREPSTQRLRFEIVSADTVYVQGDIEERSIARDPSDAPACNESSSAHSDQSKHWYEHLAALGNQFGKSLQLIQRIDHGSNNEASNVTAHLGVTSSAAALLDACLHCVLAGAADNDSACVLNSIDEIELVEPVDATATTCRMRYRDPTHAHEFRADLLATSGDKPFMQARGVSFMRVDTLTHEAVVAAIANFTLDPLKDAFDHLGRDLQLTLDLGPYDQICQTLIAPSKALGSARFNELFVFVRLQSWWARRPLARGGLFAAAVSRGVTPRLLPNGLEILELNGYETEHLYREIFDDRAYLGAGIDLRDGDTVIDIGANIGMFALHVVEACPTARVIAFEPSPITAAVLRANLEGRGSVQVREQGVGRARGRAVFRHYEKSSVFSGYATQPELDARAIRSIVADTLKQNGGDEADVDQLMHGRIEGTDFDTEIVGVSDVIDELQLAEIGLLKIDAEKSEFAILDGIREEHWPRIRQIALELHERDPGDLERVQSMLRRRGLRVQVCDDVVLAHAGLHTVLAWRDHAAITRSDADGLGLREPIDGLIAALRVFREQCDVPATIVVAPDSGACRDSVYVSAAHRSAVERLRQQCATVAGVEVASWQEIAARYQVDAIDSSAVETEAGIPYERSWYAAAAAWLLRRHLARVKRPHKVIVIDCDDTLWEGNCAESETVPIRIGERHRALQEWLVAKRRDGWLVCLSSKNCEADVLRAFEQNSAMPLSLADIVAHRVNWDRKSASIVDLARELNLALEDFIFIDNNEVECAEVAAHCPGVLTLHLPEHDADLRKFLDHIWAFDHAAEVGAVDRTELYQTEQRRRSVRTTARSFREFLDSLQLQVRFEEIGRDDLARVSELTLRTNQFNLNKQHRTVPELAQFLQDRRHRGWVVRASDRFGDYGSVGVVLAEIDGTSLLLSTVLLSCRVLGRGIEFRLVQFLAEAAKAMRLERLRFIVTTTGRNAPAMNFMRTLPVGIGVRRDSDSFEYELELSEASTLSAEQFDVADEVAADDRPRLGSAKRTAIWDERYRDSAWLLRTMRQYSSAYDIAASVWGADETTGAFAFDNELEAVRAIWAKVLCRRVDDPDTSFFALGGTSLQLVRVVNELNRARNGRLSLAQVYASPTVRSMHALITGQGVAADRESVAASSGTPIATSAGQQALWFLHLTQPRSTTYNVPIVLAFTGPVDAEALRDALLSVIAADPLLGTTYSLQGKITVPTARHAAALAWSLLEVTDADERELLDRAEDWARASLDLRAGPTMRARFLRMGASQSALMILAHHIAVDFDSMALLIEKTAAAYEELTRIGQVAARVVPTFEAFARSESNYLREHGSRLEEFWRDELSGVQPRELPLPVNAGSLAAAASGEGVLIELNAELTHRIRARAEALGVSRLTLSIAAYAGFMRLESGAQEIQIGTPMSLRSRGDFARTIGNFVNVVPLQLRLTGAANFDEIVTITRDTLQRVVAAADLPLQRILRQASGAGSDRILGLRTTLAFHEARGDWPATYMLAHRQVSPTFAFATDVRARVVGLRQQAGYCDIAFDILDLNDGLAVDVKFATPKFTRQTAESWGRRFVAFLETTL